MDISNFFSKSINFSDETGQGEVKSAKVVSACPICKSDYQPSSIDVLVENSNSYLVYFNCKNCFSNSLAVIYLSSRGVIANNVATDLNRQEVMNLVNNKKISDFEVLDLYQFLNKQKTVIKNN